MYYYFRCENSASLRLCGWLRFKLQPDGISRSFPTAEKGDAAFSAEILGYFFFLKIMQEFFHFLVAIYDRINQDTQYCRKKTPDR